MDYPPTGSEFLPQDYSSWLPLPLPDHGRAAIEHSSASCPQLLPPPSRNQESYHSRSVVHYYSSTAASYHDTFVIDQTSLSLDPNANNAIAQLQQLPMSDGAGDADVQPITPQHNPRKRKAPTLRNDDWEPVKARVIELHITKKLPLPEVKKTVEQEFKRIGFTATIRQYRTRVSQWGLDKNVKPNEMKAIVKKRQLRKLVETDKRELVFKLRGNLVEPEKIDRWMKRNEIPEDMMYAPSPAATTPAALSAWTVSERGSPAPNSPGLMGSPAPVIMSRMSPPVYRPGVHSPVPNTLAGFRIFTPSDYAPKTQVFENLPILQLQLYIGNLTEPLGATNGVLLNSEALLKMVTEAKTKIPNHLLIQSLLPHSAFKDEIQQFGQMGILLFLYLISNSFPAESCRDKIYQLVRTQRNFSPGIFRTLKGHSADSLLENLFPLAVEAEDLTMVKNLIKAGANVDANNCKLSYCPITLTPLQFACFKGNIPLAKELITAGSEIDAPESGWRCSAILLAIYGHENSRWRDAHWPKPVDSDSLADLVQKLLAGGASVNGGETGMNDTTESIRQWRNKLKPGYHFYEIIAEQHSPLTLASKYKYKELVDLLILEGADVQFRMNGTSSALRECLYSIPDCFEGELYALASRLDGWEEEAVVRSTIVNIAHSLVQAGADLNDHIPCEFIDYCEHFCLECYSVLDLAVLIGSTELVDVMLHAGAKTTYHSLDLAIKVKSFEIFSKLLANGAAIPKWAATEKEDASSLCFLNANPRDADHFDLQSKRALVLAAVRLGATSELDSLIKSMNGSTDNLLDGCAEIPTAIECCCSDGHVETLRYLLEAGIMPKSSPTAVFGRSVLLSIRHKRGDLLDLLLENGADVNAGTVMTFYGGHREVPILLAIEYGEPDTVRKLIQAGARLDDDELHRGTNCGSHKNWGNMLVAAIERDNSAVIEELLGKCADINRLGRMKNWYYNCRCCSPIAMAIEKRNWTLVDRLLNGGANVNYTGQDPGVVRYNTPLSAAAVQKHFELAKLLIAAGAVVNDRMALEAAVDDRDLLELFVAKLANSKTLNRKCNALHFALLKSISQNSIPKVKLILDSQLVDLSAVQGGEVLKEALILKHGINHTLLNMLLIARANLNSLVFQGRTALLNAISRKDAKSVEILLKAGAMTNPPFLSGVHYSPLQLAAKESSLEVLQMLLSHGCDPNIVAPDGQSQDRESIGLAIQCATERRNFEIVQLLLMHDADPNAVIKTCLHTALQIASRDGSKSIAELLIMYGADVNAPPAEKFGATALQFAALGGYLGVAHLLIEKGANINAPPAKVDGRTALEAAAEYGRIDMVQLLKNAGADLSGARDGQYERALARAFNNGHHATRRLLLSYHT